MNIRKLTIDDINSILIIENESFKHPWTYRDFEYELFANEFATYLGFFVDNYLLGYIGYWITFDIGQITKLATINVLRRRGIATVLLDWAIEKMEECSAITLEVRVSNDSAISFYKKNNFRISALRRQYYDDGEDAHLMVRYQKNE